MSLESWKTEFYPISASDIATRQGITNVDLTIHALRKWIGMLPTNLKKHDLRQDLCTLHDDENSDRFKLDSNSCSLCQLHLSSAGCYTCPLAKVRGVVRCDNRTREEVNTNVMSPWDRGISPNPDPVPMINYLLQALQLSQTNKTLLESPESPEEESPEEETFPPCDDSESSTEESSTDLDDSDDQPSAYCEALVDWMNDIKLKPKHEIFGDNGRTKLPNPALPNEFIPGNVYIDNHGDEYVCIQIFKDERNYPVHLIEKPDQYLPNIVLESIFEGRYGIGCPSCKSYNKDGIYLRSTPLLSIIVKDSGPYIHKTQTIRIEDQYKVCVADLFPACSSDVCGYAAFVPRIGGVYEVERVFGNFKPIELVVGNVYADNEDYRYVITRKTTDNFYCNILYPYEAKRVKDNGTLGASVTYTSQGLHYVGVNKDDFPSCLSKFPNLLLPVYWNPLANLTKNLGPYVYPDPIRQDVGNDEHGFPLPPVWKLPE